MAAVELRKLHTVGLSFDDLTEWERDLVTAPLRPVPEWELSLRRGGPVHCQMRMCDLEPLGVNDLNALQSFFRWSASLNGH